MAVEDAAPPLPLDAPVAVVCGHYGVGKTNLTPNIAPAAAAAGPPRTAPDLALVKPFLRPPPHPPRPHQPGKTEDLPPVQHKIHVLHLTRKAEISGLQHNFILQGGRPLPDHLRRFSRNIAL